MLRAPRHGDKGNTAWCRGPAPCLATTFGSQNGDQKTDQNRSQQNVHRQSVDIFLAAFLLPKTVPRTGTETGPMEPGSFPSRPVILRHLVPTILRPRAATRATRRPSELCCRHPLYLRGTPGRYLRIDFISILFAWATKATSSTRVNRRSVLGGADGRGGQKFLQRATYDGRR